MNINYIYLIFVTSIFLYLLQDTFLGYLLGGQKLSVEKSLSKVKTRVELNVPIEGRIYKLVLAKLAADKKGFIAQSSKNKSLQMFYCCILTIVDNYSPFFDVQKMLQELEDFGVLLPRKAAAKLKLL